MHHVCFYTWSVCLCAYISEDSYIVLICVIRSRVSLEDSCTCNVRIIRTCVYYLLLIFIHTHTSWSLFHTILQNNTTKYKTKTTKQQIIKINKNYFKYYNNTTLYITFIPFIHHYIYSTLIPKKGTHLLLTQCRWCFGDHFAEEATCFV